MNNKINETDMKMEERCFAILFIRSQRILENYSGPDLFQLAGINQELLAKFESLMEQYVNPQPGTQMKYLDMVINDQCQIEERFKTVKYRIPFNCVTYNVITDPEDVMFIIDTFGSNFYNYEFLYNMFDEYEGKHCRTIVSKYFTPTNLSNVNCGDILLILYSDYDVNIPIVDVNRVNREIIDRLSLSIKNECFYPRSVDNTLFMSHKRIDKFNYYVLAASVDKFSEVIDKYQIDIRSEHIIQYDFD